MYTDIEAQIHILEQEAYGAVMRALKAQSDALTWDKEELITNLRRELRVSDDEHREALTKVNSDAVLRRIREWRKSGGNFDIMTQSVDQLHSPAISGPNKRQKPSQLAPFGTPLQLRPPPIATHTLPYPSKLGPDTGVPGRRNQPVLSSAPMLYQHVNQDSSVLLTNDYRQRTCDPLVGRRVMRRWPADNNFHEALITDYNPREGRHSLVYDINTQNQWQEWVDLKQIPPEDIRWLGDDPGISQQTVGDGQLTFQNTPSSRTRYRNQVEFEARPPQKVALSEVSEEIEILHTDTLIQKVERVLDSSHPDLFQLENAKKMLKEHEQSLLDVISKLSDVCDANTDMEQQHLHRHPLHGDVGFRNAHLNYRDGNTDIAPEKRGGSIPSYSTGRGHSESDVQQEEDVVIV